MTADLYSDILLDLYRHPLNKKALANFDVRRLENNPLCGDKIEIFIKFDKRGKVADIGWEGDGCAISQASASLLTDYLKDKTKAEIKKINSKKMLEMLGIKKLNPTRLRCATISLKAAQTCL